MTVLNWLGQTDPITYTPATAGDEFAYAGARSVNTMRTLAILCLLLTWSASAFAGSPGRTLAHVATVCGLVGTAASVVADVYNAETGALLGTIPNGEVTQYGSTDCFSVDLASTTAPIVYPALGDPSEKHYVLQFRDDGAATVERYEVAYGGVGAHRVSDECKKMRTVYAKTIDATRGITQAVINNNRPSHIAFDVSCSGNWASPDYTYYWVYFYDASGRILDRESDLVEPVQ